MYKILKQGDTIGVVGVSKGKITKKHLKKLKIFF